MGPSEPSEQDQPPEDGIPPEMLMRSLSRRAKARRGAVVGVALLVAIAVVLGGTPIGQTIEQWIQGGRPFNLALSPQYPLVAGTSSGRVARGGWLTVGLPPAEVNLVPFASVPKNPAHFLVCTTDGSLDSAGSYYGPITLWRTRDFGAHWLQLPIPALSGSDCVVQISPDLPSSMVVTIYNASGALGPCALRVFVSENGGDSWHTLPRLPAPASVANQTVCSLAIAGHHLYFTDIYTPTTSSGATSTPSGGVSGIENGPPHFLTERSDDDGTTWQPIDTHLPVAATQSRDIQPTSGNDLYAIVPSATPIGNPAEYETMLYTSRDAGLSWQRAGQLPNGTAFFSYSTTATPASGAFALPAYTVLNAGASADTYQQQIYETTDGQTWQLVPPLPIAGTSAARLGITAVLGTLPSGNLLALSGDPRQGIPALGQPAPQAYGPQTVWQWNARQARWSVLAQQIVVPLPPAHCQPPQCSFQYWTTLTPATGSAGAGVYLWGSYVTLAGYTAPVYRRWLPVA